MNYVNANRINNLLSRYFIENTKENFKRMERVIEKRDFTVYKQISYMIDNCKIIEEDSTGIIIEIDLSEHRTLSEDLTNNFFSKKTTKYKEKNCARLFCWKCILNNQDLQWFLKRKLKN